MGGLSRALSRAGSAHVPWGSPHRRDPEDPQEHPQPCLSPVWRRSTPSGPSEGGQGAAAAPIPVPRPAPFFPPSIPFPSLPPPRGRFSSAQPTAAPGPGSSMSLLGGYRRKPGGEGYEALQLVEGGGGGCEAGEPGAGGRSPSRQPPQQQQQQQKGADGTMDSSGRAGGHRGRVWGGNNGTGRGETMAPRGQWQRGQWQRFVLPAAASPHTTTITLPAAVGWVREP